MDWQDYADEVSEDATKIVYGRYVNSEKGKKFIENYNVDINKETEYNGISDDVELYDDGRATEIGELINKFKNQLTRKQWNTYFKKIDSDGKKYNFGNNEKSVIPIGNKLVFSKYENGKPQVYDIIKLGTKLLNTYGITTKQFTDIYVSKLVKEGYNETEIREFIRNLSEETLYEGNNFASDTIANRSKRTRENDRQVDRDITKRNKRNQLLQRNGKIDNNNDVENSNQGSFSLPIEQRLTGDELLNAQDFIDEIKKVGADVDENGYVTVYHQTTKENAKKIRESGKMSAKEDGIFFSTSEKAQQADGKGTEKLKFKIPAELLELDDIFEDNADVKIPLKSRNDIYDVSKYIVNDENNNENTLQNVPMFNSEGRSISDSMREWLKGNTPELVDRKGNEKVLMHVTPNYGFTKFDSKYNGTQAGNSMGDGFYFTESQMTVDMLKKDFSELKRDKNVGVYKVYLSLKNPLINYKYDSKSNFKFYFHFVGRASIKRGLYSKEIFQSSKYIKFEKVQLLAPILLESYLMKRWGENYMTPPNQKQIKAMQHPSKWNVNESFLTYSSQFDPNKTEDKLI